MSFDRYLFRVPRAALLCALGWLVLTLPGRIERLTHAEAEATRAAVLAELHPIAAAAAALPDSLLMEVDHQADQLSGKLDQHLTRVQTSALERVDAGMLLADARIEQGIVEVSGQLAGFRADLRPALTNAALLLDTYRLLPDRVGAEVRPAWLSLQPEITCERPDGSGYGGCWHSRITAVLGEAANAGGVFVQRFPEFSASLNGIAGDAHAWTDKYIRPRPLTLGGKIKAAFRIGATAGISGLRGGVW